MSGNLKRTWAEVNKERKEKRKDRNFKKLIGKLEKEQEQELPPEKVKALNEISTISIAVPGSILDNAPSEELRSYLAGQIGRAACIFQVDEIIVYDDYVTTNAWQTEKVDKKARRCCVQLGRILQYMECPQYLRKFFFPMHNDLKYAGLLNPLDAPHHLRTDNTFPFREGIVTDARSKQDKVGCWVDIGLTQPVFVEKQLVAGIRCTVKLKREQGKKLHGAIVSPKTPRFETGVYWGYSVRIADSLSKVFTESPYKKGYDVTIGTSDRGESIDTFVPKKSYQHLLIVFGGLYGLEAALENDDVLKADDPSQLFNYYLNTLPEQGSRTIRMEEAMLVSLASLRTKMTAKNKPMEFVMNAEIAQSQDT